MCCDRRGNIWVGTYFGGVNYFSPGRDDYVNFNYEGLAPRGLYHSYINSMVMDNDGSLWFGTDGAGVCCVDSRLNIKKQLTAGDGPNALRQNNIKCLAYDSASDRLFIGTHLGGLSVYDVKKGTTVNLIDNPEYTAAGNVIHALKIYGDRLYISSREGLSYIGLNDRSMKITRLKCGISPYRFDFDDKHMLQCRRSSCRHFWQRYDAVSRLQRRRHAGAQHIHFRHARRLLLYHGENFGR